MSSSFAPIRQAICFHHPSREAAARCMSCGRSFCRECVTPLDLRMFCASCYKDRTDEVVGAGRDWFLVSVLAQGLLGLAGLWLTAYFLGRLLLEIPAAFHEGSFWGQLTP